MATDGNSKASISGLEEGHIAKFGKPEFQEGTSDNGQFRWKLEAMCPGRSAIICRFRRS